MANVQTVNGAANTNLAAIANTANLQAEIEKYKQAAEAAEAENARLKAASSNALRFKVGEKGGLSVFGMNGKFPTTLYYWQWLMLLDAGPEIRAELERVKDELATQEQVRDRRAAERKAAK